MVGNRKYRFIEHRTTYNLVQLILINIVFTVAVTFRGSIVDYDGYPVETLSRITPQASTFDGFMAVISFTLYPAYISSVVIVGFLFNKSSLNLYFLVVQGLVLYLSLGWGIDVLVHRITLTLPLVHWFQLRLLLVNWEYLVDSLSGIMLILGHRSLYNGWHETSYCSSRKLVKCKIQERYTTLNSINPSEENT